MSGAALLDVNVLVALFSPEHMHHEAAHDWFADHHERGWATCAASETGFIRILANPAMKFEVNRPVELVEHLRKFCSSRHHEFWADAVSLTDSAHFNLSRIGGHRHLTDVYLLGLAKTNGGHLVTFDGNIPLSAVVGATRRHLTVLTPAG